MGLSEAGHGANYRSVNGGLTYEVASTEPQATQSGYGITVRGKTDIGEFLDKEGPWLELSGHYQLQDRGFVSSRNVLQQGNETAGGLLDWRIGRVNRLKVRHDTLMTLREDYSLVDADRAFDRHLTSAQYTHRFGRLTLVADVLHARDQQEGGEAADRGAIAALVKYAINARLSVWLEQQALLGNPASIDGVSQKPLRSLGDHVVTGLGLDVALTENLSLTVGERIRWSGEDSSVIGMRARLSEAATMYFEQRLLHARDSDRWVPATVVGSEETWGGGGRSYGEYQVGQSSAGTFNRAVLGLGRRFEVMRGWYADIGFERYHMTALDDAVGEARDGTTLSLSTELVRLRRMKLSTRFEARFENSDADRLQILSFTRLTADLGKDVSLFAKADLAFTQNKDRDKRESESADVQLGLVYRPLAEDFSMVFRAGHIVEMRPAFLDVAEGSLRTSASVVSIEPIVELPLRLQLTPKLAFRHMKEEAEQVADVTTNTLLGALRLSFHLLQMLDLSTEYRWMWTDRAEQMTHGALAELSVTIAQYVRIGAGYNFSGFDDDLFDTLSRDDHGFFVRLSGMY